MLNTVFCPARRVLARDGGLHFKEMSRSYQYSHSLHKMGQPHFIMGTHMKGRSL